LDELLSVLVLPAIRDRHGLSDDELVTVFDALLQRMQFVSLEGHELPATLTRDPTDLKFLSVCTVAKAGYLITNDRRHLGVLRNVDTTRIVTPGRFLEVVAEHSSA
jgi:predicted nucleic acid-binding protein